MNKTSSVRIWRRAADRLTTIYLGAIVSSTIPSEASASVYAKANDPVDFAQKIVDLIADPGKRETAGEVGRSRIENHLSWEHQIPELIAAYSTLFRR